jgi:hypothetical protein
MELSENQRHDSQSRACWESSRSPWDRPSAPAAPKADLIGLQHWAPFPMTRKASSKWRQGEIIWPEPLPDWPLTFCEVSERLTTPLVKGHSFCLVALSTQQSHVYFLAVLIPKGLGAEKWLLLIPRCGIIPFSFPEKVPLLNSSQIIHA